MHSIQNAWNTKAVPGALQGDNARDALNAHNDFT